MDVVVERVHDLPLRRDMTREFALVRDVLLMLQGFESGSFVWDQADETFTVQKSLRFAQTSESSFRKLLGPFLGAASSLRKVEQFVKTPTCPLTSSSPMRLLIQCSTLQAFTNVVSMRLQFLRSAALEKQLEAAKLPAGDQRVTLLSLVSSLSWVCAGAVFLEYAVETATANAITMQERSVAELASSIVSALYAELYNFCLVRDGGEQAYRTLLVLLVGSLQPLVDSLDTWIREGILDGPVDELFFYADSSVTVEDDRFWFHAYKLRSQSVLQGSFMPTGSVESTSSKRTTVKNCSYSSSADRSLACPAFLEPLAASIVSAGKSLQILQLIWRQYAQLSAGSSKSHEVECMNGCGRSKSGIFALWITSLTNHLQQADGISSSPMKPSLKQGNAHTGWLGTSIAQLCPEVSVSKQSDRLLNDLRGADSFEAVQTWLPTRSCSSSQWKRASVAIGAVESECNRAQLSRSFETRLPQGCIKDTASQGGSWCACHVCRATGRGCEESSELVLADDAANPWQASKKLLASPALLPSWQKAVCLPQSVPGKVQTRSSAEVLQWIQGAILTSSSSPAVLLQECLIRHIDHEVEAVHKHLLQQLMGELHLVEDLSLLRTIFFVGSGDLLQQFLTGLFNKLDRGEPWDDYHELNSMLQESIRSSVNEAALSALDSLSVEIEFSKFQVNAVSPALSHVFGRHSTHGIDALESMRFVYKVAWPLELIIGANAIKKYNKVTAFLMKVKRAKHVLDKACRYTWKTRGGFAMNDKKRFLLQHKLMHFVNALHQYVMDKVLYSTWVELCEGMSVARSLDEVILCHDVYLTSIQKQCLVAPDKVWTLIASRVTNILSLALDYYALQCTLGDGVITPAVSTKCQLDVERISKAFDEYMGFLLRVLSFKLNLGQFPHLVDLITQLNYNFFYVSEQGQLLTSFPDVEQHSMVLHVTRSMTGPAEG